MARKTASLELSGGRGPRQRIWDAIRALGKAEWTNYAISRLADADDETAYTYVRSLRLAGIVTETRRERVRGKASLIHYRLARDVGIEAPRLRRDGSPVTQGLAQEQMWRTLRLMTGDTNARELAAHASTEAVLVNEEAAGDYLRNLARAKYVRETVPGRSGGRLASTARYRLINDTGPRPPMICRAKCIYDANLARVVWQADVTDEDAIYA